ncbi:hypothetical protein BJY24_005182 [Nocardia transvalensis]|uniref:DUF4440 domain-containing protein n=1 Tax=Nocardia transvalensis TaxID=37333 RepID=A0A7W9PI18_9NOCA|nr:hypothetical protein [Nocardia transvalensis]MBB5916270.1 hypothetical protein [Nocardia transvalensis]
MNSVDEAIKREVRALHADLECWLGTDASADVFDRFAAQQHPELSVVTVSGAVMPRATLLAGLRSARNTVPRLTIEISDLEPLVITTDYALVRFLERHRRDAESDDRVTTALLHRDVAARNGLRWHTVHETVRAE